MKSFVVMAAIAVTVATVSPSNAGTEDTDKPGSIHRFDQEHRNWVHHTNLRRNARKNAAARAKQIQVAKAKAGGTKIAVSKPNVEAQPKQSRKEPLPLGPDPSPTPVASRVVAVARQYIGSGPVFGRRTLWCGRFTSYVLEQSGYKGGSNLASDYARYGRPVNGPQVGALAVMSRGRGGGHVGIVTGTGKDRQGNPTVIIISGNHNNRVAESAYPRGRIYAYRMPG